jgi:ribosomal protein S18 acetylase RimI-like enzyme
VTIAIRPATVDDAGLLHQLASLTFALACPPGTTAEEVWDFVSTHLSEEHFTAYIADAERQVLIAETDGEPAGYSMLVYRDTDDADVAAALTTSPSAELSKLYVVADSHGAGVGAALMNASVADAKRRGYPSVWLGVNKENVRANRFYEKQGFRVVGSKSFQLAGRVEDDHVREHIVAEHPATP